MLLKVLSVRTTSTHFMRGCSRKMSATPEKMCDARAKPVPLWPAARPPVPAPLPPGLPAFLSGLSNPLGRPAAACEQKRSD